MRTVGARVLRTVLAGQTRFVQRQPLLLDQRLGVGVQQQLDRLRHDPSDGPAGQKSSGSTATATNSSAR